MKFFRFEKEKLRDAIAHKKPMDYQKQFSDLENDALMASLKYASPAYLDSHIQYFPSYEKANRIELTLSIEDYSEVEELIRKIHKIVLGRYEILCDFWFLSSSKTNPLALQYPRYEN